MKRTGARAKGKTNTKAETVKKIQKRGTAKKAAKKTGGKKTKQANPVEMRQNIANIVDGESKEIARALAADAKKGQLATAKYLWEVAGVYPPSSGEGAVEKPEENVLAKRLLKRFGIPDGPLPSEDDDEEDLTEDGPSLREDFGKAGETLPEEGSGNVAGASGDACGEENGRGQAVRETIP